MARVKLLPKKLPRPAAPDRALVPARPSASVRVRRQEVRAPAPRAPPCRGQPNPRAPQEWEGLRGPLPRGRG
eukprot:13473377-Alexandrium_andersonii.AAC.1